MPKDFKDWTWNLLIVLAIFLAAALLELLGRLFDFLALPDLTWWLSLVAKVLFYGDVVWAFALGLESIIQGLRKLCEALVKFWELLVKFWDFLKRQRPPAQPKPMGMADAENPT